MVIINKVYNLDCFEFLKQVKKESIDLAVIDPPYNMKKAEWDTFKTQQEFLDFTFKWVDLLIQTLKKYSEFVYF